MTNYKVTREFTGGNLKGLSHTATSSVHMPVGFSCKKPIGGSPYIVTACEKEMKSTFWMSAQEAEDEIKSRELKSQKIVGLNPSNYPFSDSMVFCPNHTKLSDVIDVVECPTCHAA